MWADNIHREPDNAWQGFFLALGLFIMLESLAFTVVDGLKWTNLLFPLTFVLAMSVILAQLRLTFHLYLLNPLVGAITILYSIHSLFYLQPITDPSWLYQLYQDVQVSLRNLSNGKIFAPEQIGLYTLLVLSIIWFLANYSLNLLVKKGKINGVLILGLGFQGFFFSYVKHSFSGANFAFMFVGLVLLSALRRSEQKQKWKSNGARYTEEVAFSWMAKSLLYIGLIVGIAAGLPAIKATLLQDNPRFQSFATQMPGVSPDAVENGLSETNTSFSWSDSKLGGPWEQSSTSVMSITSDYGAYWRGGAKDIYTGSGWEEGRGESTPLAVEYSDKIYRGIKTITAEQTVRMQGSFTVSPVVFGATMPVQVTGMTNINRNFNDNLLTRGNLKGSTIYKVVSEIPELNSESIELLRKSGNNYPVEIRGRYLALPKVPQRVIDLAKQISEEKTNPYDKAQSLADYFQKNDDYVYDLNPLKVPPGRDFVEYFLETQKGYCTYYSTAMAVMARAIGLPSRWVSGYSMGESNEKTSNTYKITAADMHAWVEIYFNGYHSNRPKASPCQ